MNQLTFFHAECLKWTTSVCLLELYSTKYVMLYNNTVEYSSRHALFVCCILILAAYRPTTQDTISPFLWLSLCSFVLHRLDYWGMWDSIEWRMWRSNERGMCCDVQLQPPHQLCNPCGQHHFCIFVFGWSL